MTLLRPRTPSPSCLADVIGYADPYDDDDLSTGDSKLSSIF